MKLTKAQSIFLERVTCPDYEEEIYRYKEYNGKWCYLLKRLGTCDIHLTNRCRSLDKKGYLSSNEYDTIKVTFKTLKLENTHAEFVMFRKEVR